MIVEGPVPHEALRALLQFEAAKYGLSIKYETADLRSYENGKFIPRVEIVAHIGDRDRKFQIEHDGKTIILEGDVHG